MAKEREGMGSIRVEHSGDTDYLNYEQKRSSKPVVQPAKTKPKWEPEPTEPFEPDMRLLDAAQKDLQQRNIY